MGLQRNFRLKIKIKLRIIKIRVGFETLLFYMRRPKVYTSVFLHLKVSVLTAYLKLFSMYPVCLDLE
jgi:hypothetical protein